MSHWADEIADRLPAGDHVLATGISPSGEIHIGNLREVMTADAVHRALRERGVPSTLIFIADNLDPLRRVYPFLDTGAYAPRVGQSLSHIPCPCGKHASYSEHFLEPFLASLDVLEADVQVVRADRLYGDGRMNGVIARALECTADIARILSELTGKQVREDWSPFDVRCTACARLTGASVTGFDVGRETVSFRCECGGSGEVPFAGGGKLTWRVDWPARWKVLGVTLEPFGKDHASRGGSYDTGVRIAREIFDFEPPFPVPYEWIALKGKGDMSSSKGNVLSIHRMLEVVPPEVLRYFVLRAEPPRAIRLDPGLPLVQLTEELEDPDNRNHNARAAELARVSTSVSVGVPFRHLITVAQIAEFDLDRVVEVLSRTGYEVRDREALATRLRYVRAWLDGFAPADVRFAVAPELPAAARTLAPEEKDFLRRLAERLPDACDGDRMHGLVYDLLQETGAARPAPYFRAIYLAVIGKERGPRAGHFLAALPADFLRRRLREAAGA